MQVKLWVCPTDGCTNYYGSSSMGDLTEVVAKVDNNFTPRPKESHHTRAQCPDCRTNGIRVERELLTITIAGRVEPVVKSPMDERSLA